MDEGGDLMTDEYHSHTRLNRFEKKRKNTRWLSIFIVVGAFFTLILIGIFIFTNGDKDDQLAGNDDDQTEIQMEEEDVNVSDQRDSDGNGEEQESNGQDVESDSHQNPDDFELELIGDSADDNVIQAYTSTWSPIKTEQSEPHEITWEQSSQDWHERLLATELATGIAIEDMDALWISGNGPESVIVTFSDRVIDEHYRVYLSWVEHQGWRPDKVELLRENDQLHRFN